MTARLRLKLHLVARKGQPFRPLFPPLRLDCWIAAAEGAPESFAFRGERTGSLAASLGDALCQPKGRIHELFVERPPGAAPVSRVQQVFDGLNLDGKLDKQRRVRVRTNFLPPDCVEIVWGKSPLTKLEEVRRLAARVRESLGLSIEPEPPIGEGDPVAPSETSLPAVTTAALPGVEAPPPLPVPEVTPTEPCGENSNADGPSGIQPGSTTAPTPALPSEPPSPPAQQPPVPKPQDFPDFDGFREPIWTFLEGGCNAAMIHAILADQCGISAGIDRVTDYVEALLHEVFPPGPIQPRLLQIKQSERAWTDDMEILSYGNDPDKITWTVKDICQGTLILGAPGSGKTTGSGRTIAFELLSHGFGGLVLTTKQGEAGNWIALAAMVQRQADVAVVTLDGPLRLNALQYEIERPGGDPQLTENLIPFFRNLASAFAGKDRPQMNEGFWQTTGDELLRNVIDSFLLAGLPLTLDNTSSFIASAPKDAAAAQEGKWQGIPVFGEYFLQVETAAKTPKERRAYEMLREYWLSSYPTLNPNTRSCITTAFSAMVRALRSGPVHDLLSTLTTITPESIFNGRIVILNLPVNEFNEAGRLVQTVWKYLFQRAVLRRADRKTGDRCRPVFLWEDECHNFLIDFDADFQPVAQGKRI